MKIKFFSNYDSSENLLNRFKLNYDIYDNELEFTIADDYNFAVVFNGAVDWIKPSARIITIIQEPSWSILPQDRFLTGSDYLLIHAPDLFEHTHQLKLGGEVLTSPAYMFYDDKIQRNFFDVATTIKKTKKVSMIVSALHYNIGNYIKRLNLLGKILESDIDIDIYGRGFNIPDERYKGEIEFKYEGLMEYEYSIAIENSNERNYVSEKFVDCVLCNTIPIYNGAPNIAEIYDQEYFKTIDLDSFTIIDDIKAILLNPANATNINKDIYFNKYNLYAKLKEVILNK